MNDLRTRGVIIVLLFATVFFVFITRLLYLQVISTDYALTAEQIDIKDVPLIPSRGIIYDRNDNIYVQNTPILNLEYIPNRLVIPDTSVLEELLNMTRKELKEKIKKHRGIGRYQTQVLDRQIDIKTATQFMEKAWNIEGLSMVARNTRDYRFNVGANFLGYINQVSKNDLETDPDDYYRRNDLIGISGIERQYEKKLRGNKGKKTILVDNYRREIAKYADGKWDYLPVEGKNLRIGVDEKLQTLGEQLMQNKKGSIVAIEPATGEILAFISAPCYEPRLFTGGNIGRNYAILAQDTLLPLFNRPLMAKYPPGSIFKMLQALAAMAEGVIDPSTHYLCIGKWARNKGKPKCHGAHGTCSLSNAVKFSCNAYFAETYYNFMRNDKYENIYDAYQHWYDIMYDYGIGHQLGIDIPNERKGHLPTTDYYDKKYGKNGWGAFTIYSNSIGQGEILMTPLQMANSAALIANRGWYVVPHFMKSHQDSLLNWVEEPWDTIHPRGDPAHYEIVIQAMEEAVSSGTGTLAQIEGIRVAGKTGTVENPPNEDHSVFMSFAPAENPQIAIAVIVENAGYGGTWAAPIASLMMEQYINGEIKSQAKLDRILNKNFINPNSTQNYAMKQ